MSHIRELEKHSSSRISERYHLSQVILVVAVSVLIIIDLALVLVRASTGTGASSKEALTVSSPLAHDRCE